MSGLPMMSSRNEKPMTAVEQIIAVIAHGEERIGRHDYLTVDDVVGRRSRARSCNMKFGSLFGKLSRKESG